MEIKFKEQEIYSMIEFALLNGGAPLQLAEGSYVEGIVIPSQNSQKRNQRLITVRVVLPDSDSEEGEEGEEGDSDA